MLLSPVFNFSITWNLKKISQNYMRIITTQIPRPHPKSTEPELPKSGAQTSVVHKSFPSDSDKLALLSPQPEDTFLKVSLLRQRVWKRWRLLIRVAKWSFSDVPIHVPTSNAYRLIPSSTLSGAKCFRRCQFETWKMVCLIDVDRSASLLCLVLSGVCFVASVFFMNCVDRFILPN